MKIMKILICNLMIGVIFLFTNFSFAQDNGFLNKIDGDVCYVYVVDVAKAKQYKDLSFETKDKENDAKLKRLEKEAGVQFPKFFTVVGEEVLTTKHFRFPNSNLMITASVFYTDESMASYYTDGTISTVESMLVGIAVSKKPLKDALNYFGKNAVSEITYDGSTNVVQTFQYLKIKGKSYLVSLVCDCKREKKN